MTDPAMPMPSVHRRMAVLWTIACLLLFAILSYSSALQKCATFDESLHAAGGAFFREAHQLRVDPEDPALFMFLSSLPHGRDALKINTNSADFRGITREFELHWKVGIDTLFHTPGNDGAAYVNQSRFVFTLIGVATGALLSFWAFKIGGAGAAIIAVTLFALDPNMLAHASLVKNDVPTAAMLLWIAYLLWRIGQRITPLRIGMLALACAMATNIKFSALIFGPIVMIVLLARALLPEAWLVMSRAIQTRIRRVAIALGCCAAIAIFCWGFTCAVYAADRSPAFDWSPIVRDAKIRLAQIGSVRGTFTEVSQIEQLPDPPPVKALAFLNRHHVMPRTWLTGLLYTWCSTIERPSYLLGNHSLTGWWCYFPLVVLFKTPLTVLALMLIGGALGIDHLLRRKSLPNWTLLCLWLPIVIYGTSAMTSNLNLGIRHILPIYPFVDLLIAIALARWLNRFKPILIVALIALSIETISVWPDYIPFFNIACGGSRGGLKLLGDSNLDWGQDLPLLAEWQHDHPGTLYLSYFGTCDPAFYGIIYNNVAGGYGLSTLPVLPPTQRGVFAISASNLQGIFYTPEMRARTADLLAYLRQRQPIDVLGGSIYLFDWNPTDFAAFARREHS